jgi:ribosomal protein S27AE
MPGGVGDHRVKQETLYKVCPLCDRGSVVYQSDDGVYRCGHCELTLPERSVLGLFRKGRFGVSQLGQGDYSLARSGLKKIALSPDSLKVVIGNVYTDRQLAAIAGGALDVIRPVKTVLAEIILEQLNETTYLQVNGLRRGYGAPIAIGGHFQPVEAAPRQGLDWQDVGNLFGATRRLVFPSNTFTFIRLDRRVVGVRAFTNGVAVQRKGEDFATYFAGCYPHEAALVAAFTMAKLPALR